MIEEPSITKEEFIDAYCGGSSITRRWLFKYRKVIRCYCDYAGCRGWAAVPLDDGFEHEANP